MRRFLPLLLLLSSTASSLALSDVPARKVCVGDGTSWSATEIGIPLYDFSYSPAPLLRLGFRPEHEPECEYVLNVVIEVVTAGPDAYRVEFTLSLTDESGAVKRPFGDDAHMLGAPGLRWSVAALTTVADDPRNLKVLQMAEQDVLSSFIADWTATHR